MKQGLLSLLYVILFRWCCGFNFVLELTERILPLAGRIRNRGGLRISGEHEKKSGAVSKRDRSSSGEATQMPLPPGPTLLENQRHGSNPPAPIILDCYRDFSRRLAVALLWRHSI